jgi:hypothetical protein
MLDLGFLTRWSNLSRWLLSVFGGCGVAILLLLHGADKTFVPGSTTVAGDWYRVGLFAPGNDHGKIDEATAHALSEAPGIATAIVWSTQDLAFVTATGESGNGAFAFVDADYLQKIGLNASDDGDIEVSDGAEILLTARGADALSLDRKDLPAQVRFGSRHFLVRSILPEAYTGPLPYEPVLGLIHRNWQHPLVFAVRPRAEAAQFPIFTALVHAPAVSDGRALAARLITRDIRSDSPFLAESTRNAWSAFRGPYRSPAEANAERLFRTVLLVISLSLFATACLVYVVAESLSNANLIRTIAIREALGERSGQRTRWLLSMSASRLPSVAGATFLVAIGVYVGRTVSLGEPVAGNAFVSATLLALPASFALTSVPALLSFGSNYLLGKSISIGNGLGGHHSRLLYDALAGKLLIASAALLSAICSASLVFFAAVTAFNARPLGFSPQELSQATILRPDDSPESPEAGIAESVQIETLGRRLGVDLGATSCAVLGSESGITNLETPTGVAVALICHATPGAIEALDLEFLNGGNFAADDEPTAIATSDFMTDVNGGGHVGTAILKEAMGRAYRVTGVVRPVNLNAAYGRSPPVVFLNGSEFGLRGTLLIRGDATGMNEALANEFGADSRLGEIRRVGTLIDARNASFLSQRTFALIASACCAALCALALIACCLLVLVARKKEIGIRLAIGASDASIARWTLGSLIGHIGWGLAAGFLLAPPIGLLLNRILPVGATAIVGSVAVSVAFCMVIVVVSAGAAVRFFVGSNSVSNLIRQ